MAISEYNYIPTYIKRTIANKPKDVVTASYWNELFNLLIKQGDHTAKELGNILNHFTTVITGAASDTADAIAAEHEYASAFEIHLSTNANLITADKTFAEIRQAIVDKREILLWVSEVQCLKPTCKAFEHTITLTVFDYSPAGPVVRADVYECYDENEWFVEQNIELAKQNDVGDIRNLTTTHKYNLVAAVNEVKQTADGKYVKPTNGIPKTDLANDVQTSLDKADTALQTHQSLAAYRTAFAQDVIDSDLGDRISAIESKESGWDAKQDKLTAGDNITITENGTISSTGGGAKAFFLNVFVITETQVITNKTYAEIKAAIDAGDIIYITDKNGIVYVPQVGTTNTKIELLWIESQGNRTLYWTAVVDSENAWSAAEFELVDIDKLSFELNYINEHKVDKVTGKGLSTNDYTAAAKAKVDALKPVATSGSYNDLTDKPTIPSVPTATINANAAARHEHGNKTVLDLISETVKAAWDAASTWVTTNGANVLSHLSDSIKHITAAERTAWNGKQDKLIAGENITIAADGKTISATGGGGGGSAVELDTTLSKAGKAADAKAVGDALAGKQDTISDLATIRTGAAKGATALQAVPSTYRTATAQDAIDNGLSNRINAIEGKEAGWNSKYVKPTNGIPKTDLANDVQASLGKADTALQSVPSTYRTASAQDTIDNGKVDKVTGKGLSTNDYTAAAKAKVDAIPANPKYTDTVYNDTAVKNRLTAIENKENVTLTADTSRITNVSYTAKYFQLLGIVFVRIYGKINASLNSGYDYDLFTIDNRVPDSNAALSVKCAKNAMAVAKTSSNGNAIQIRPLESGINGYDVYITGFWFV